jgi:pSer/pThr/pTyr-binding forkhead associated (FHA) protein
MQRLYLEAVSKNQTVGETLLKAIAINRFPSVIGRHSDCEYCLNYPFISRRHCSFFLREGRIWVEDLGSQNGTKLNGEPVRDGLPIRDGDHLDLGYLSFNVHLSAATPTDDCSTVVEKMDVLRRSEPALIGDAAG